MRPVSVSIDTDAISATEIRTELQKVLASTELVHCPQLQRFLNFVVEEELAGRGDQLKEYVLAVGVFGRPADFDPRLDSLVRVEARRLRAALEKYYAGNGSGDPIVIELQKGAYLPSFRRSVELKGPRAVPSDTEKESSDNSISVLAKPLQVNRKWMIILGVLVGAFGISVATFLLRSRPTQALTERDSIVLTEFVNTTLD
jgi:hypothetical protein